MQHRPFTYLFWIQYLGYRYHGWQKQPNVKTVQERLERVIRHILKHENFTILGAGRTDSGVSCQKGAFELFTIAPLDIAEFVTELNTFLPDDIRILSGQKVSLDFNIIQHVVAKEYRYNFAFGDKLHPFGAANVTHVQGVLDIELMQKAAKLFEGKHDFRRFCAKNKNTDNFIREIFESEIGVAEGFSGGFFPDRVFCFRVKGNGFLMHQVRLMMGALFELGKGEIRFEDIEDALGSTEIKPLSIKAPAHGLILEEIWFGPI